MNLTTFDVYGHIPNMWELKAQNDSLAAGVPAAQWVLMDAAEHDLLDFPSIGGPPYNITMEQALLRPQYANGNLRHIDMGIQRYGSFSAVVRNDVMRARAVINGGDSGGWENVCNTSLQSLQPHAHLVADFADCNAINSRDANGDHIFGSTEHLLHTLVSNYNTFGTIGGGLPRLVRQMLEKDATFAPVESLFYLEGQLLGLPKFDELKLMVASFPDIFGTADGDAVRDFCRRWRIPLAWGLGGGKPFSMEEADKKEWIPESPFARWPVAADRLLDVSAWSHTNASSQNSFVDAEVWSAVETEVKQFRRGRSELTQAAIKGWWDKLTGAGGALRQLVGSECSDIDTCFGTIKTSTKDTECVCAVVGHDSSSILV